MWHDTARLAAAILLGEDAPSTSTPVGAIAGLLTALAAVLGALTGLFVTLRRSTQTSQPLPPAPAVPLNTHADDEEDDEFRARIRALETALWRRQLNPNRVITGEEPDSDLRFD